MLPVSTYIGSTDLVVHAVENPMEWPNSAQFAVRYTLHDRQFPQVKHGETTVYFDCVGDLLHWLEEKRDWVKGTDNDFSMTYSVYEWDWGPNFRYSRTI